MARMVAVALFATLMLVSAGVASAELTVKEWYPQGNDYVFVCESPFAATSWDWDFGDGTTQLGSDNMDVYHSFTADGEYTVSCTAHGEGTSGTYTLDVTVGDGEEPPVEPTGTVIVVTDEDGLTVDLLCSNDFGATVFDWNFGDGMQLIDVQTQAVSHTYAASGSYDVTCTAWAPGHDAELAWDRITVSGEGGEEPPVPTETAVIVTDEDGLTVDLLCANDFEAEIFDWNFGDGTQLIDVQTQAVSHTYAASGSYDVTCTAWAPGHDAELAWALVTVDEGEEPPVDPPSNVTAEVVVLSTDGLSVELQCANDFDATHIDWNLRDGTTYFDLETDTIEHTYAEEGTYGVSCTAWSAEDGAAFGYEEVTVSLPPPDDCTGCEGNYTLTASKSYGPSNWTDGTLDLCSAQEFIVPDAIPVTAGNAGNHWTRLTFNDMVEGNITTTTCLYQGGSSQAHPNTPEQLALGTQWLFVGCYEDYDGSIPPTQDELNLTAGDGFTTDFVLLSVNGDSAQGTTEATLTLENQLVCEV